MNKNQQPPRTLTVDHPSQFYLFIACLGKAWMQIVPELIKKEREEAQREAVRDAFNNPPQDQ